MQRNVRKVHTSGRKGALQSMVQAAYNGTLLDHPLGICLEEYLSSLNYTASAKKKGVYIVTRDFSSPSSDFLLWNRKRQSTTVLLISSNLKRQERRSWGKTQSRNKKQGREKGNFERKIGK